MLGASKSSGKRSAHAPERGELRQEEGVVPERHERELVEDAVPRAHGDDRGAGEGDLHADTLSTPVRPASCPAAAHLGGASLLLLLGHTRTRADDHRSAAAATIPRIATSGSLVGGSARRRPSATPSTRGARARSSSGCRAAEGRHVMGDGGAIDERFGGGRSPRP